MRTYIWSIMKTKIGQEDQKKPQIDIGTIHIETSVSDNIADIMTVSDKAIPLNKIIKNDNNNENYIIVIKKVNKQIF